MVDQQIEELKELLRRNIALSEETNKAVHSMRNSARLSQVFRVLWWVVVFGGSTIAYYYYVQPYVDQLQHLYASAQTGGAEAQNFGKGITNFFAQFFPKQ